MVKVRVTSVVLVTARVRLETLLDIDALDAGGRTRRTRRILPMTYLRKSTRRNRPAMTNQVRRAIVSLRFLILSSQTLV